MKSWPRLLLLRSRKSIFGFTVLSSYRYVISYSSIDFFCFTFSKKSIVPLKYYNNWLSYTLHIVIILISFLCIPASLCAVSNCLTHFTRINSIWPCLKVFTFLFLIFTLPPELLCLASSFFSVHISLSPALPHSQRWITLRLLSDTQHWSFVANIAEINRNSCNAHSKRACLKFFGLQYCCLHFSREPLIQITLHWKLCFLGSWETHLQWHRPWLLLSFQCDFCHPS